MIGFDPLSSSPFAKGEMKKGPKNFESQSWRRAEKFGAEKFRFARLASWREKNSEE